MPIEIGQLAPACYLRIELVKSTLLIPDVVELDDVFRVGSCKDVLFVRVVSHVLDFPVAIASKFCSTIAIATDVPQVDVLVDGATDEKVWIERVPRHSYFVVVRCYGS